MTIKHQQICKTNIFPPFSKYRGSRANKSKMIKQKAREKKKKKKYDRQLPRIRGLNKSRSIPANDSYRSGKVQLNRHKYAKSKSKFYKVLPDRNELG